MSNQTNSGIGLPAPNPRLQRTRQLTRFRRQNELMLDHWETRRYRCSRRNERYASTASSSLGEHRFQVLQDEVFVGLAVRRNPTIKAGALTLLSPDSGSERRRTGCPLNRVNIPRLRSPLSRKSFGARIIGVIFVLAAMASCTSPSKPRTDSGPVAKVFVQLDGTILLNGQPTTLENLKKEFVTLKSQNGSVWYSRANPEGEPPPHAMEVIQAVVDAGLPVRLLPRPE